MSMAVILNTNLNYRNQSPAVQSAPLFRKLHHQNPWQQSEHQPYHHHHGDHHSGLITTSKALIAMTSGSRRLNGDGEGEPGFGGYGGRARAWHCQRRKNSCALNWWKNQTKKHILSPSQLQNLILREVLFDSWKRRSVLSSFVLVPPFQTPQR